MSDALRKNILLVDDEVLIGMATKQQLEKIGYVVVLASNGEQALQMLRQNNEISLVLMDIDLGNGKNGIMVCQEIIKEKNIPIVFVSSHTDPGTVSLTEQVTSYGYIVKSSSMTVYDASIKMAYKLFNEKKEKDIYSKYLETALNNAEEPVFICDLKGDVIFFNKAYLHIQGLSEPQQIQSRFDEYSKLLRVFSDNGIPLEKNDWASTRGLRGLSAENVVFYVYHYRLNKMLINYFSYAPIYDDDSLIIGSYVKILRNVEHPDQMVIGKILKELNLPDIAI